MNWEEKPVASAIVSIIVLFGTFPFFTLVFWGLSLWKRRYLEKQGKELTKDDKIASDNDKAVASSLEEVEMTDLEGQELHKDSIPVMEQP